MLCDLETQISLAGDLDFIKTVNWYSKLIYSRNRKNVEADDKVFRYQTLEPSNP